jgi:polyisoprenoid-binding protein YceI
MPATYAEPPTANYQVDTNASRIYVKVMRTNRLGHNHGVEGKLSSGSLKFGGKGNFTFDMTSFTADTAAARKYVGLDASFNANDARKVNANMRGAEVLDVARHPQATLEITEAGPADKQAAGAPGRYVIGGQFTLHGVKRKVRFLTELAGTQQAGAMRLRGWFTIQQTQFGITPFSVAGGAIGIEDELTIYGDLILRPAAR